MQIKVASIFVKNQDEALKFYTEVLGFVKKTDVPTGDAKWLTVVAPDEPDGTELLLEPNGNPIATTYQQGLREQGIPATVFFSPDVQAEYERLTALGVEFQTPPTAMGPITIAVFDDTCGNLIQIVQEG